jgi:quercetin dioxygenase-like cupin family protein
VSAFSHYSKHVGSQQNKYYKATLFKGSHLMVGVNCLEPGQTQAIHDHSGADKVYIVMEGRGYFTIGEDSREALAGGVIWAPAGMAHGVVNRGTERLELLVGIAPPPRG